MIGYLGKHGKHDCLPWQTWQGQERRFQELDLIIIKDLSSRFRIKELSSRFIIKDLSSRFRIEARQRAVKFRNKCKYSQLVNG